LIIWKINQESEHSELTAFGEPFISLTGHNHFISDLCLSSDYTHVISSSWDKSLRLWSLKTGKCVCRLSRSDQKEILSVAFSPDYRQIFSCGVENKLTLWNTKGDLLLQSSTSNHTDWTSRIRYSTSAKNKFYASVGWDGLLKIWTEFFKLSSSVKAHEGPIYALAISGNGHIIATGGKDQVVKLWKVGEFDMPYKEIKCDSNVVDLAFHPEMQWLSIGTETSVKFLDLNNESDKPFAIVKPIAQKSKIEGEPRFTCIAWSVSGKYLYAGASDAIIRVYKIEVNQQLA
jgi:guanine nucleotide-binding protein subunit beta-2-like 1 protein